MFRMESPSEGSMGLPAHSAHQIEKLLQENTWMKKKKKPPGQIL